MSDLLSPILYLMDDEVEAFWCFVGFMERLVRSVHVHVFSIKGSVYKVQ